MRKYNANGLSGIALMSLVLILLFFLASPYQAFAEEKDKKNKQTVLYKPQVDPFTSLLNVNNLTAYVQQNGQHPAIVGGSWSSTFPKGTAGGIYQEGIVWGGLVDDGQSPTLRVGGNTYFNGTKDIERIYRVRPDYKTANLADDAANFFNTSNYPLDINVSEGQIQEIYDQYEKDWNEWPGALGAPYEDVDENGAYDPNVDIPGIPGASQTLWIYYNDDLAPDAYGSPPIGIEVQETYWAYSIANPLGNVVFKKVNMVYVGTENTPANATIDDMYITQWSDPDVGQYTDDFAGCDTLLNLGYAYSSATTDAVYLGLGLAPPALGYDFFQGVSQYTGDPNDSAIVNLKWQKGYKYVHPPDKPMTTFTYFAAGGAWGDPDGQDPLGTPQWYNLMRGYLPRPPYPAGEPFPTPGGGTMGGHGTYLLSGDPVTGEGWIDGQVEGPGDRRIVCVHGPFNMSLNDTAEVVLAILGGIGSSNLSSISVLKYTDRFAQYAYDNLFDLPVFPSPSVTLTNFDGKVLLNWGTDEETYSTLEGASPNGYDFEGYNVYQLPTSSSSLEDAVKIATFDLVNEVTVILDDMLDIETGVILKLPVQVGKNTGIKRFMEISTDAVRNEPLRNGSEYYFAVTAYGYNPDETLPFNALESSPTVYTAVPQTTLPGVRYTSTAGDTVEYIHYSTGSALGDGSIIPLVVDPSLVTGNRYTVTFDTSGGSYVWALTDSTNGEILLSDRTNQTGDDNYVILEGMMVKVLGPSPGVKSDEDGGWDIPQGTRRFTWANADGFGWESFHGALGWGSPSGVFGGTPEPIGPSELKNVLLILGQVSDTTSYENPMIDPANPSADENFSYAYRYGRGFSSPPARPEFAPYIINTDGGGYHFQDFNKSVPLSAWDVEDPANPRRLAVGFLENNADFALLDGRWFPGSYGVYDNTAGDGPREWLFIYDADYSETPNPDYQVEMIGNPLPIMYWFTANRRGVVPFSPDASGDDHFAIYPNKINTEIDVYSFTAPEVSESSGLAKTDVEKINVFPNPYYGFHSREITRDGKFVTFSHLPPKATIRLFDLAGVLVRTIEKDDVSQFIRWNLQNDDNYPVASGIYIVYIDIPELGTSKILKLAIIQEEQILRTY